jgi:hypothetical protein
MSLTEVDFVVFEIGGERFAADLGQIRRIDASHAEIADVGTPLGIPRVGARSLIFEVEPGLERRLTVDRVLAVSRVPVPSLRRMPAAVHAASFSVGAWLDGETPVMLVDLLSMVP